MLPDFWWPKLWGLGHGVKLSTIPKLVLIFFLSLTICPLEKIYYWSQEKRTGLYTCGVYTHSVASYPRIERYPESIRFQWYRYQWFIFIFVSNSIKVQFLWCQEVPLWMYAIWACKSINKKNSNMWTNYFCHPSGHMSFYLVNIFFMFPQRHVAKWSKK